MKETFDRWFRRASYASLCIWLITQSTWTFVLRPAYAEVYPWWAMIWLIVPALYLFYSLSENL